MTKIKFPSIVFDSESGEYVLCESMTKFIARYGKNLTCPAGMRSDGASSIATDIQSIAWWFHDRACVVWQFDDGTPITTTMCSMILHDLLLEEGRWIRARSWFLATRMFGPRSPHG